MAYNPRSFTDNGQRYQAWVAAGRPAKDDAGNDLDVRGEYVNLGFDAGYQAENATSLTNLYGSGALNLRGAPQNNTNPFDIALGAKEPAPVYDFGPLPPKTPTNTGPTTPGGTIAPPVYTSPSTVPPGATQTPYTPTGTPAQQNTQQRGLTLAGISNTQTTPQGPGALSAPTNMLSSGGSSLSKPYTATQAPQAPKGGAPGVAGVGSTVGTSANSNVSGGTGSPNTSNPTAGPTANTNNPIGVDQNTGRITINGNLMDRMDSRLWGRAGMSYEEAFRKPTWVDESGNPPPYSAQQLAAQQHYNSLSRRIPEGYMQLSQSGLGGTGEAVDHTRLVWDDDFGVLTPADNFKPVEDSNLQRYASRAVQLASVALPAAFMGGMIPGVEGIFGAGAGAGAASIDPATGYGLGGSAGEAGAIGGMGGTAPGGAVTGAGVATPAGAGAATGGAGTTAGGAGAAAGSSLTPGTVIRGVGTVAGAVGAGGGSGGGTRPTGGGSPGGGTLADIVGGVVGRNRQNNNIGDYQRLVDQLIERGDPYGPQRAAAIQRLADLERNPGDIVNNPLFSAMNQRSQDDLSRRLGARGYLNSGNELGGLQNNFLANMEGFYGKEWERRAREAGVYIDPSRSVAAGMEGGGQVLRATNNSDAATSALVNRILGSGSGGSGNIIQDILDWWNSSGGIPDSPDNGSWSDIPDSGNGNMTDVYDDSGWGGA